MYITHKAMGSEITLYLHHFFSLFFQIIIISCVTDENKQNQMKTKESQRKKKQIEQKKKCLKTRKHSAIKTWNVVKAGKQHSSHAKPLRRGDCNG